MIAKKRTFLLIYKACKHYDAENYQANNRLFSRHYQVIIRSLFDHYQAISRLLTPRLAPAAPALASSRPCSVLFSPPGSGCSIRRSRSPRDRRAGRHPVGRYRNSGPAPRGSLLRPVDPAAPYCCYSRGCFPGQSRENPELMGCGLFLPSAAHKRRTAAALGIRISQKRPCPAWGSPAEVIALAAETTLRVVFILMVARPSRRRSYAAGSRNRVPRRQKRIIFCLWHVPVPVPSGGCTGRRTGALAPVLPFLTVLQPLSPSLRAAVPSASLPCRTALCRADRPSASLRLAAGRRLHKDGGSHTAEHLVCSCWRTGLSGLPPSPGLRPASVAACPLGPVRRGLG